MAKVALVTGAGQGLGLSIAQGLSDAGFLVALSDINLKAVEAETQKIRSRRDKAIALKLDVLNKQDFKDALETVIEKFGGCDVLVNNAAMTPTTPVMDIGQDEFDNVINVNLRGTFFACQVFGAYFSANKYGRIINVASLAGQMGGTATGAHYAMSKGGILTLTKVFARLLADSGVTVNAIAPGPLDLPSTREKVPGDKLQNIIDTMIPVKAMGSPKFIAAMVAMLASLEANTVTGSCWDANGGIFMR